MKQFITCLVLLGIGIGVQAQIQTGIWRSPSNNTEYNQFIRNGGGATLLVNQVSPNNSILALSSETATAGENIRFVVVNDGSVGIGKASVNVNGNYRLIDIVGKTTTAGGMLRMATADNSGSARIYANDANLAFHLDKSTMQFQWKNATGKEIFSLQHNGWARWSGNAMSYTEVASNASGQYLRQYGNDGTTQAWIIRGYAMNGVQAIFNVGGVDVNGRVRATEVQVKSNIWADYVFNENYNLMPLSDLKSFIGEHKHLPGIPAATEVKEEGVRLGEMNRKLLEKIEELTLHVIRQQEELNSVKSELRAIKAKEGL